MADPTSYSRSFSFTGYQTATPQDPLPAPQVDTELDAVSGAIATLVAAVEDVRRSDGALKNGSVTLDALSANLLADIAVLIAAGGISADLSSFLNYQTVTEAAVTAASTTDLGAVASARVVINGTTTITSFGTGGNKLRFLRFAGSLTLTHNATTLILPGGANIATQAGDTAIAMSDGSGNWRVRAYSRADGTAVAVAPLTFTDTNSTKSRTVLSVLADYSHSIAGYNGVDPSGVTASSTGINLALTNQKAVFFPPGNYKLDAPLTGQAGAIIEGPGYDKVRLQRSGVWAGDTLTVSGPAQVRGLLFEQLHPGFVPGTSTTMTDRLTTDQAHITLQDSSGGVIENCWVSFAVYGVKLLSATRPAIRDLFGGGSWDAQNGALCETKAVIYLGSTAGRPYNTEPTIERVYLGGGNTAVLRNITVGTTTFSTNLGAGCQDTILIEGMEGGHIKSSYVCANRSGIRVVPNATSICRDFDLTNLFVDAPSEDGMYFGTNGGGGAAGVTITGNKFNGQTIAKRAITIDQVGTVPNLFGAVISGNVSYNHLLTPFLFFGAKAVGFKNNIVNNYHCRAGLPGDTTASAGLLVGGVSANVEARDNFYGGGANNWSGTNNCQYGEVFGGAGNGRTGGVNGIFGLAGGAIVQGITPLY
jgi:hypothetical protein